MRRPLRMLPLAVIATGLLFGCRARQQEAQSRRIASPPSLLVALDSLPAPPEAVQFIGLEPYERARDLEVLIFSTRSPAFWGVILPGRWLQLQSPWVERFEPGMLSAVRRDVAAAVTDAKGALAVPLSMDGPVVVIRQDLWHETGLPPPRSLAALREGVRRLRATKGELATPVVSDLPEDLLFWGLAWSYEGSDSADIYSYPKLHALRFMDEFNLSPAPDGSRAGAVRLEEGRAVVLFTTASQASRMEQEKDGGGASRLWVGPLPGQSRKATAIYNGWCLASPKGAATDGDLRRWLLSPAVQDSLRKRGLLPALAQGGSPGEGTASWALDQTHLCAPPPLDDRAREAVRGAILDATEGPISPEEALRRAQARLQSEAQP